MALNNKQYLMSVYLDFSKAFDTVNRDILLITLHHDGIRGVVADWFATYLCNRKQYTAIKNSTSDTSILSRGVLHGTILEPVPFLLYINDMCN